MQGALCVSGRQPGLRETVFLTTPRSQKHTHLLSVLPVPGTDITNQSQHTFLWAWTQPHPCRWWNLGRMRGGSEVQENWDEDSHAEFLSHSQGPNLHPEATPPATWDMQLSVKIE